VQSILYVYNVKETLHMVLLCHAERKAVGDV